MAELKFYVRGPGKSRERNPGDVLPLYPAEPWLYRQAARNSFLVTRIETLGCGKGAPHCQFALDTERQEFQRFECPQTVFGIVVQLQAAYLLCEPRSGFFQWAGIVADFIGQLAESVAVAFNPSEQSRSELAKRLTSAFLAR